MPPPPDGADKTKELGIEFRKQGRRHAPVCISGAEVEMVYSIKFLGVMITNNLSWSIHINTIGDFDEGRDAIYCGMYARLYVILPSQESVCDNLLQYLSVIVLSPEFRPWEVASTRDRLKVEKEIAYHRPQI
eukprot:g39648.t1